MKNSVWYLLIAVSCWSTTGLAGGWAGGGGIKTALDFSARVALVADDGDSDKTLVASCRQNKKSDDSITIYYDDEIKDMPMGSAILKQNKVKTNFIVYFRGSELGGLALYLQEKGEFSRQGEMDITPNPGYRNKGTGRLVLDNSDPIDFDNCTMYTVTR